MPQKEPDALPSHALLEQVLEILPVGVWIMDRSGRIVQGNAAGHKIWAGARYVGTDQFGEYKGWWRRTGKPIEPGEWAAARAISQGETSLNEEIEIECFDGTHKIILNSALPIRNAAGEVIGGIIVNLDITDRIALEEQLRTAERLRDSLAHHPYGALGPVACSFGVGEYHPGEAADDLIRRADQALYAAKAAGRDRVAGL